MDQEFVSRIELLQKKFKKRVVSLVRPESEFPELTVTVPDSWKSVQLAPLYDVHIGSGDHDAELFQKHLEWIAKTPNVLTWNGGDMVENATKYSPGASAICQAQGSLRQMWRGRIAAGRRVRRGV